jgi:hypothetical protein
MSKPNLDQHMMCRMHPNYKAGRAPLNRKFCSVCNFMWTLSRKNKKRVDPTLRGNSEGQGMSSLQRVPDAEAIPGEHAGPTPEGVLQPLGDSGSAG